jgi:hypothetical protein
MSSSVNKPRGVWHKKRGFSELTLNLGADTTLVKRYRRDRASKVARGEGAASVMEKMPVESTLTPPNVGSTVDTPPPPPITVESISVPPPPEAATRSVPPTESLPDTD